MIVTLQEAKARLSSLVETAARGEEVLIIVRGRPQARLTGVQRAPSGAVAWTVRLARLQKKWAGRVTLADDAPILDALRAERV